MTETKASDNGCIRIPKAGISKFAFGEDGPEFALDVRDVSDEWYQIDMSFRDADRNIPKESLVAWGQARKTFVQNTVAAAYRQGQFTVPVPALNRTEVDIFMSRLAEEVEKTRLFTDPVSLKPQESRGPTELRFSQ